MTEIDVPDWVVEAGVKAMQTVTHWESHEDFRQKVSQAVITAALGAWAVPTGTLTRRAFDRFMSSSQGSQAMFHLSAAYDDDVTLYTLRKEKPE